MTIHTSILGSFSKNVPENGTLYNRKLNVRSYICTKAEERKD